MAIFNSYVSHYQRVPVQSHEITILLDIATLHPRDPDATSQQVTWFFRPIPKPRNQTWFAGKSFVLFHVCVFDFVTIYVMFLYFPIFSYEFDNFDIKTSIMWGFSMAMHRIAGSFREIAGCPRSQRLTVIPSDEVEETCQQHTGWNMGMHHPGNSIGLHRFHRCL